MKSHARTERGAGETFLKHLYVHDWDRIDKVAQQKRRGQLQNRVSIGRRWISLFVGYHMEQ